MGALDLLVSDHCCGKGDSVLAEVQSKKNVLRRELWLRGLRHFYEERCLKEKQKDDGYSPLSSQNKLLEKITKMFYVVVKTLLSQNE